jgi:hypothetical protein
MGYRLAGWLAGWLSSVSSRGKRFVFITVFIMYKSALYTG